MTRDGSAPTGRENAPDAPGIEGFALGLYGTNCYVVTGPGHAAASERPAWIVDAGLDPQELIASVRGRGLRPELLVLTHAHLDHIAGVGEVRRAFPGIQILVHEAEEAWLNDPLLNLSAMTGEPVTAPGPDRTLREGDVLELGGQAWAVLHTPGHSPGGISLYNAAAGIVIAGDALFAGSIGRTDFPGSDPRTLADSIRRKLYTLPDETIVYPGHGPPTTIGREKRSNPFVRP